MNTRHNVAWKLAEELSFYNNLSFKERFNGAFSVYMSENWKIRIIFPSTYMNKCGESIAKAADFFSLSPKEILIVHDDLELNYGDFRYEKGGGQRGHNGLRSVIQHLGTKDFVRFRVGIGRPPGKQNVSSYVLSQFSQTEKKALPFILQQAALELEKRLNS